MQNYYSSGMYMYYEYQNIATLLYAGDFVYKAVLLLSVSSPVCFALCSLVRSIMHVSEFIVPCVSLSFITCTVYFLKL